MANRRDIQFLYNPHNKATLLDCNFTVAATNGAGITGLAPSGRISTVFMHTSTTPVVGNPNPAAGYIYAILDDNYNKFLGAKAFVTSAVTGSALTSGLTVGVAYVITTVGASTRAQWTTAGLPANITPALGVSFIAKATSIAGGGAVKAVAASGIDHVELIGAANLMNSNGANVLGLGSGMQLIFACYSAGSLTAPAAGTQIYLQVYLNNSAFGV